MSKMKINIVNQDSDSVAESIGVSAERINELEGKLKDLWPNYGTYREIICAISEHCENPAELILMGVAIGHQTSH